MRSQLFLSFILTDEVSLCLAACLDHICNSMGKTIGGLQKHTFRHWKATMEYHRTKNIKWVQQLLGHKKPEIIDMYTQLTNFEGDEWHVAHARNLEEESKLIEAGFEYV